MSIAKLGEIQHAVRNPPRKHAYTAFVATLALTLVLVGSLLAATEPALDIPTLVAVVLLMLVAEHRDRLFGDETSISGSIVVAMAAAVAFTASAPLLGPFLCGAAAGLYWPHLRDRVWSKVIVNAASIGLSALGAALVMQLYWSPGTPRAIDVVVLSIPAVLLYWLVNSTILASATALLGRSDFRSTFLDLVRSETEMLLFALAGAMCGLLFFEVGTWAGAISLAGVLVAVDVIVISRPHPYSVRMRHPGLPAAVGRVVAIAVGAVAAWAATEWISVFVGVPVGATAAFAVTTLVALTLLRRRLHTWDVSLAVGVALADAPYALVAGCAGTVAAELGVAAGAVVGAIGLAVATWAMALRRRRTVEARPEDDRVYTIVERALLDYPETSSS